MLPLMCSSRFAHLSAHPPPPGLGELCHRLPSHVIPSKAKPTRPTQNASPLPSSQLPDASAAPAGHHLTSSSGVQARDASTAQREHNPLSVKLLALVTNHSRNLCLTFCRWCVWRSPNSAGMATSSTRTVTSCTTSTARRLHSSVTLVFCVAFVMDLNGRPMADRGGAAKRRRERRLRSWLRHERMTVAAELSAALHHSRDGGQVMYDGLRAQKTDSAADGEEVVHDAHDALRGQKTPPPGVRPGSLCDLGPQRSDHTVRRSSGDSLPTLALPVLAGSAGEVVDSSSLRFLTASALKARREEEEEKEKKKEKEKMEKRSAVHVEAAVAHERARLLLEQASKRRKRKKRRKRRTPRTSSRPSFRRPRRRPRRWHAPGWFSSVFLLALCSSLSLAGPRCLASRPFWIRRTVTRFFLTVACARLVLLVLYTSRCVFSLVCRPMMLGIKAGMDQTDILALVDTGSCMVKAGFTSGYDTSCVFPWGCRQVCDVRHHGWYGPEEHVCRICHRCSSWMRLSCPLCAMTYGLVQLAGCLFLRPLVSGSHLFALWFDSGSMLRQSTVAVEGAILGQGVLALRCATTGAGLSGHFCCGAEAVPHGPALLALGAVLGQGCCYARCWSMTGAAVPQLQFLRSLTPLSLRSG